VWPSLHGLSYRKLPYLPDGQNGKQQQDYDRLLELRAQYEAAKLLEHPMPNPAAMTTGRLPKPAAVTITNSLIE
jgi:hypothetical protein